MAQAQSDEEQHCDSHKLRYSAGEAALGVHTVGSGDWPTAPREGEQVTRTRRADEAVKPVVEKLNRASRLWMRRKAPNELTARRSTAVRSTRNKLTYLTRHAIHFVEDLSGPTEALLPAGALVLFRLACLLACRGHSGPPYCHKPSTDAVKHSCGRLNVGIRGSNLTCC